MTAGDAPGEVAGGDDAEGHPAADASQGAAPPPAATAAEPPPAAAAPAPAPKAKRKAADAPKRPRPRSAQLAAPPNFRLFQLGAIADGVVVTSGAERHLATTYFDTADLRLVRWGATLRHRAGEGWLLRLADPEEDGHPPEHLPHRHETRFEGGPAQVPAAAQDLLTAFVRTATLVPVAKLRTIRRTLTLRTHEGARLAEIDDDEVSVLDGRRVAARFREVDVELDDAAPDELLDGILERLHVAGAGLIDPTPKLVHALGARALEPPEVVAGDLPPAPTAAAVVQRALASSVARLLRYDAWVRVGGDPEGVHQARVATRRLRSDLRTFAPLLQPGFVETLRGELAWIAAELGAVRDTEVLLERLHHAVDVLPAPDRAAGARLLTSLEAQLESSRAILVRGVRDRRYLMLLDRLVLAAREPELAPAAAQPAGDVVPQLASGSWRRLQRAVRRLPDEPPDERLHEIRIYAKRARYAAEAVSPLVGRRAAAFARSAAELQSLLGDFHDAVIAQEWLRGHAGRGAAAFAAGQVYAAEEVVAQHGRDEWPAVWKGVRRAGAVAWR